ncbi:MAG: RNA methyltransferase [Promethearchaeota archaeon]
MKKKELQRIKKTSTSQIKSSFQNLEISVILVEPQGPINVGMTCRVMKNFGFLNLILFNPRCEIGSDARKFSMHGLDILKNARVILPKENNYYSSLVELFKEYTYVIGTSGKKTRFNNVKRIIYYVDEIDFSQIESPEAKVALVFGREDTGLSNEEIGLCDFILKIPVDDAYPTLNLSHAVAITLFSVFKKIRDVHKGNIIASSQSDRDPLYATLERTMDSLEYTPEAKERVVRSLKNILGRSFSSLKEINLLISLFSSINKKNR